MENNDNNKRTNVRIILLTILCLAIIAIGASFAYFTAKIDNDERAVVDIETADVATINYKAGNELNFFIAEPGEESKELIFSVALEGSKTHDTYSYYDINWTIKENGFVYGENKTPELLYDLYKSSDGKTWEKVVNNKDCTTISGTDKIITKNEIFAPVGKTTEQYWKVVLRFVNLNENQNHNQNKTLKSYFEVSNME